MTPERWQLVAGLAMGLAFIFLNQQMQVIRTNPPIVSMLMVGLIGNLVGQILVSAWVTAGRK